MQVGTGQRVPLHPGPVLSASGDFTAGFGGPGAPRAFGGAARFLLQEPAPPVSLQRRFCQYPVA